MRILNSNWVFEENHRKIFHIRIPFYQSNEHYALKFIRKMENFYERKISPCYNLENKEHKITI